MVRIFDCDTTIKLLYGHQDGAQMSYNPMKPGDPSHVIHTYWIADVRKGLDTILATVPQFIGYNPINRHFREEAPCLAAY